MPQFDNFFDSVLARADDAIRGVMGVQAFINNRREPVCGVFDDPASAIPVPGSGAVMEEFSPTLFVKSADVAGIRRRDLVSVKGTVYWVTRVGADDGGSLTLYLEAGEPPGDRVYR